MIRCRAPRALALTAALAVLAVACDDAPTCELAVGAHQDAIARVGCPGDFAAQATTKDDSVFARTETILVIIDREDGDALHFIDSTKYALHYQYASEHLNLAGKTAVGTLADFNILNYRRPNRRFDEPDRRQCAGCFIRRDEDRVRRPGKRILFVKSDE